MRCCAEVGNLKVGAGSRPRARLHSLRSSGVSTATTAAISACIVTALRHPCQRCAVARPPAGATRNCRSVVSRVAPVGHPWLAAVGVAIGWRLVIFAAAFVLPPLAPTGFPELGALVVNLIACLVPLAVIARLGWWRMPWLVTVRPLAWLPLVPLAVLYAGRLMFGWQLTLSQSAGTAVFVLVAAASEELYSRGVIQELLRAVRPLWRAAAVGLLFGLGHILSGVVFGRDLDYLAFQVPHAVVQGFALAGLRMLVVSLWPIVLLHAESNLLVLAERPGAVPAWWEALQLIVMLTTGLLAVRLHERTGVEPHRSTTAVQRHRRSRQEIWSAPSRSLERRRGLTKSRRDTPLNGNEPGNSLACVSGWRRVWNVSKRWCRCGDWEPPGPRSASCRVFAPGSPRALGYAGALGSRPLR